MKNEPQNNPTSPAELELLALLCTKEDDIYPWDTLTTDAEAYFLKAEQLAADSWLEQEASALAPNFLHRLDGLWQANIPVQDPQQSLQAKLVAQFADCVPQEWLAVISRQAIGVINSQKSLGAQLVQCIQELVPNCLEEDLLVLARPYAYAMRSNPTPTTMPLEITAEQWATLSEIQQAKFSLAIARYALEQSQEENI